MNSNAKSTWQPAPREPRPCRLEINNAGSWKLVARFDLGAEAGQRVLDSAAQLAGALSEATASGAAPTLRVATDATPPKALMYYSGWTSRSA